jgi:hypothetical protein
MDCKAIIHKARVEARGLKGQVLNQARPGKAKPFQSQVKAMALYKV